ncbi:MAG: hypothetical protein WC528_02895 [Patescibacteria group bacterium]
MTRIQRSTIVVAAIAVVVILFFGVLPPALNHYDQAVDKVVKQNCDQTEKALSAYYRLHSTYPMTAGEMVQFLPKGEKLVNPYTLRHSEPRDWDNRTSIFQPGALKYQPASENPNHASGYVLYVLGGDGNVDQLIDRTPPVP